MMEEKKAGAYSYGKLLKQPGLFNRLECYGPDYSILDVNVTP